jgi:ABC-2 type transport system permease protein
LLGLLGATLVAAVGVLISLRAATVRQAQQTLSGAIVVLLAGPVLVARFLPATWKHSVVSSTMSTAQLTLLGLVAFAAVDAGVVMLAQARFRRARLIAE